MKQLSFLCALSVFFSSLAPAFAETPTYRLQYGDAISVTVIDHPELSLSGQPIRPDGHIALPLVQDIFVQGKTVPEATRILSKAYSSYLAKPRISIGVAKFRPLRVTVMGQVDHPGTFAFEEAPTISEAIANAGGLTKRARRNEIKIVEPDGSTRNCDLDQLLSGKEERLQEGTVIEVKEIWGPDLDQTILLISTMIGAAVVLIRR